MPIMNILSLSSRSEWQDWQPSLPFALGPYGLDEDWKLTPFSHSWWKRVLASLSTCRLRRFLQLGFLGGYVLVGLVYGTSWLEGEWLLNRGWVEGRLELVEASVFIFPLEPGIRRAPGEFCIKFGCSPEKTLQVLSEALIHDPYSSDFLKAKIQALLAQGKDEEAMNTFRNIVALWPNAKVVQDALKGTPSPLENQTSDGKEK